MPHVCLYFQVHQPYRLRDLRITEIGSGQSDYFDHEKNREIFRKVAEKCYLPANALMLELVQRHPEFRIAYSLSGTFIDQCREYGPDVLESFQALARTGKVEFLAETYEHSLSYLKSIPEFCAQVRKHVETIQTLFGQTPTVFRNTELIYCNDLAHIVRLMGFRGMLAEGADFILRGRTPNVPYMPPRFRIPRSKERAVAQNRPLPKRSETLHLLLKNYRLSDDVAFRFSNKNWAGYPLRSETFCDWMGGNDGHTVNLFMDYETFGEHQWADTGIFDFLRALPQEWEHRGVRALTPSQAIDEWTAHTHPDATDVFDAHACVSWADIERDLSAWLGNTIQHAALDAAFSMEDAVKATADEGLLRDWRRLLTSDHYYYMCTKYWSDGDVHKYFSPYDSPYEAYRRFSHALEDLRMRVARHPQPTTTRTDRRIARRKRSTTKAHTS